MRSIHEPRIEEAIDVLGLSGSVVCCHASMRSFSENIRTEALIDAFLAAGITLVVPTFSYHFEVPPPDRDQPANNGMSYDRTFDRILDRNRPVHESRFQPHENSLSQRAMGALPATVLAQAGRIRGNHPLNSFSAIGPLAETVIGTQTPLDVYAPFRRLLDLNGKILMCGTDTTSMTFIHYAEQMAGQRLFIRWALTPAGKTIRVRVGGCSNGFRKLMPVVAGIATTFNCLGSTFMALDAQAALGKLIDTIRDDPGITHCSDAACERCNDAMAGGPG